ncbi:hypothetical protein KIW84_073426 [Lathyrus oleraceus]|uniref:Arabidopsis retrotransposon Orf1 C-terminal domain-containing protein n=1 Tax=Pisum sativum TaxID=3888 RepID=A0A9D4VPG4_PEA|nr:hypothetical protein KIW84_073426 [Pisum sativum]
MPPITVRPRREINYMGIEFSEGIDGENQRRRYHKLFKRNILATRYPDDDTLHALGFFDSVSWMLNKLGVSHFCFLTSLTYIRLTYEFLSSFRYTTPIGGSRTTDTAQFRMFNRKYSINQDQLADLLSFHHGDEFTCQHPLEIEWESSALDFWKQLTGKTTTDWEGLKATAIQNPTIRDLFLIFCALSETKVNPTSFLLGHFQSTSVRIGGPICVGELITSIALALNLGTELSMLEPLETPFANLDYYRSMCLIKNKPDSKYFLTISNQELNHMEQDAPHTGTHAHTAHAFPNSFAGELRHQNDANTEHDVLLRHIQRQQKKIRVTIDQIRETQLDFVERTELNMGDLTEQMAGVHLEVAGMREYMQHVPNPAFGRGCFA